LELLVCRTVINLSSLYITQSVLSVSSIKLTDTPHKAGPIEEEPSGKMNYTCSKGEIGYIQRGAAGREAQEEHQERDL
jgi:hypothetical protein